MKTMPVKTEVKPTDRRDASVSRLIQKEQVNSEIRAEVSKVNPYTAVKK